jgi:integrase
MRIRIKGLNRNVKRLADGRVVTYYYAWKGGPALQGKPGSPEFFASYQDAIRNRKTAPDNTLQSVLLAYQQSQEFLRLAERTRSDYLKKIAVIEKKFSDLPLKLLADRRCRGVFKEWRDRLAAKSRRQADYAWTVLALVLSWAFDRGLVLANPCQRGGRLYKASRAEKVWTEEDEGRFVSQAPQHLHLPLLLALWTGQRQGDLLRLPWSAYDGSVIRLRQSKTGRSLVIPVGAPLKAALDAAPRRSTLILTNLEGRPWTPDGFRSSWRKGCAAAGIVGLTFHDLRGTAVTRLAMAGCTEPQIVAITGHSLHDVTDIMGRHYLYLDPSLSREAIRKYETRTKSPN